MKKLMVAIAAVATGLGLRADALGEATGSSFEAAHYVAGEEFNRTLADEDGGNTTKWFATNSVSAGTIGAYADGEAYQKARPDMFEGGAQTKYLQLETAVPLYRGASDVIADKTEVNDAFAHYDIGATGLYVDQLVKFTSPSDSDTTVDLDGGKIAIWLKEVEAATNFVITAGRFTAAGAVEQFDYIATLDGATLVGGWHRVTVKAIKITDNAVGFVVYIDGVAVSSDDAIKVGDFDLGLNSLGQKYATMKQLFPSADLQSGYATQLAAVGYVGTGAIDDVSITPVVPTFARDEITFALTWDPNAFTAIKAGDEVLTVADGSTNLTLAAGTTQLTINATPKAGYTASLESTDAEVDGMTFKFNGPASGQIVSTFNYFEVDGVGYPTFAKALAAAGAGATITLKGNCTIDVPDEGYEAQIIDKNITLDLAGNNLYIHGDESMFEIAAACICTVINSGDDAKLGISDDIETKDSALFTGAGQLVLGTEENQDGFVVIDARVMDGNDPRVYQAKILKALNTDKDVFDVPETSEMTSDDNYWIVQKKQPPKGTVLLITDAGTTTNDFETLVAAVEAAPEAGATIELTADLSGAGIFVAEADQKNITIDLGGKTYTCVGPAVGSAGTVNQAFHLEKGNTVIIKNGTLAVDAGEAVTRMIQGYADITLDGVTIDATNLAANTGKPEIQRSVCEFDNGTIVIKDSKIVDTTAVPTAVSIDNWERYSGVKVEINGSSVIGQVYVWSEGTPAAGQLATVALNGGTIAKLAVDENDAFTITKADAVTLDAPAGYKWKNDGTLTKIELVTLTITQVPNCTIVVSNATAEVASGTTFDKDDETKLTVYRTPVEGYVLDACQPTEEITMSDDVEVTAAVKKAEDPIVPGDEKELEATTLEEAIKEAQKYTLQLPTGAADAKYYKKTAIEKGGKYYAVVDVDETQVTPESVKIDETAGVTVSTESFVATVKDAIPGLFYGFVTTDSLGGETVPVYTDVTSSFKQAVEGEPVVLTAPKAGEADAAFFKVSVRATAPQANE